MFDVLIKEKRYAEAIALFVSAMCLFMMFLTAVADHVQANEQDQSKEPAANDSQSLILTELDPGPPQMITINGDSVLIIPRPVKYGGYNFYRDVHDDADGLADYEGVGTVDSKTGEFKSSDSWEISKYKHIRDRYRFAGPPHLDSLYQKLLRERQLN